MNQIAMEFTPLPMAQRVATARELGDQAGARAADRAEEEQPEFRDRALEFIVANVRERRRVSGENIVSAAKCAGIRPPDDRAFGPVFKTAIRRGLIRVIGYVPRVRGHGAAGGKLYAPGF